MNKPKDVASHCSCGAELDGEGWTADRLCQMCWEGYCGDKFWDMAMSVNVNEFKMPILIRHIPDGFPKHVLIPMECEQRAMSNHSGQDFETLASRGGLDPDEAVAIMEDRRWRKMGAIELVDAFRKYHWI